MIYYIVLDNSSNPLINIFALKSEGSCSILSQGIHLNLLFVYWLRIKIGQKNFSFHSEIIELTQNI